MIYRQDHFEYVGKTTRLAHNGLFKFLEIDVEIAGRSVVKFDSGTLVVVRTLNKELKYRCNDINNI